MKKKTFTRIFSLLLVFVLSLSLIACSSKSMEVSKSKNNSTQATSGNATDNPSQNPTSGSENQTSSSASGGEKPTDTPVITNPNISDVTGPYTKPTFTGGTKGSDEFTQYCNEQFKELLTTNLIDFHYFVDNPSSFGITEYDKTFGEVDLSKLGDTSELEKTLTELMEFDYNSLTETQQQTYDIIYDSIIVDLAYADYELFPYTFGESFGMQSQLPILLAEYNLRNENDVIEYIQLLNDLPRYYQDLMDYEKLRVEKGFAMSDQLIEGIISQCEAFIVDPDNNYLIETFNTRINSLTDIDDAKKAEYITQNKDAVINSVIPAYQYLITEFNGLLGKGNASGGIVNYDGYKEYFEYFLRSSVGTDKTPDDVNALLKEYAQSSIYAIQLAYFKDSTLLDKLDNPTYKITEPEKIIEDLKQQINADFPVIPDCVCNLHTVHESLSEFLSPAFYLSSPIDNSSVQNIYINNGADTSFSGLYPTLAHEGYPGHLYQTVYYANTPHELIRNALSFTGYSEGWATYVETISYAWALDDANLANALAANNVWALCMYGQMDLGINYYNWSMNELASFTNQNFGISDEETLQELYGMFIENPGNYLHYVFGYIEIMEMREYAEAQLGSDFNLKEFHKFFLSFGDAPFYVINSYIDNWIATQK